MRFLSVCSGIEAASVAWHPLGWRTHAVSEIEAFPCAVLAHHYPDVPNLGDMTKFKDWPDATIDLLVGGTPCQSFSVAGLRKGLDDPRGNLMLTYLAIAARARPRWLVWENVPGVLSSNGGRDFGTFLGALAKLGYGFAHRVLDAQFFGVPQRRRRVFVVGCLGDWRGSGAVLSERHGLSGNPAPRRQAWQDVALPITTRVDRGGAHREDHGNNLVVSTAEVSHCLNAGGMGRQDFETETETETLIAHALTGEGFDASEDGTVRGTPLVVHGSQDPCVGNQAFAIGRNNGHENALIQRGVRRLTPLECERLQGFPDRYTAIPLRNASGKHNGRWAKNGPRYKALGNSMAVPCMAWIGRRIATVDSLVSQECAA